MECQKTFNAENCPCTYSSCPRKGACCECVAYHRASGELPGCYFPTAAEREYDRSIEFFIATRAKR